MTILLFNILSIEGNSIVIFRILLFNLILVKNNNKNRNSNMDLNANRTGNKRERRGRLVSMHVHGHNRIQAADRGRIFQG